jgi:hypothetical protein
MLKKKKKRLKKLMIKDKIKDQIDDTTTVGCLRSSFNVGHGKLGKASRVKMYSTIFIFEHFNNKHV